MAGRILQADVDEVKAELERLAVLAAPRADTLSLATLTPPSGADDVKEDA